MLGDEIETLPTATPEIESEIKVEGCTMPHNEWRVYEENTGYANVDDYLFNAKKVDISISYYDAPDKAVDVRQ